MRVIRINVRLVKRTARTCRFFFLSLSLSLSRSRSRSLYMTFFYTGFAEMVRYHLIFFFFFFFFFVLLFFTHFWINFPFFHIRTHLISSLFSLSLSYVIVIYFSQHHMFLSHCFLLLSLSLSLDSHVGNQTREYTVYAGLPFDLKTK